MSEPPKATATSPAAYRSWRVSRLGAITDALEERLLLGVIGDVTGRRILDAGCGDGVLVCRLASLGADATGIDADPAMVAAARARADAAGIEVRITESRLERLPFPDGSFDVVVAVTVLCFVPDAAGGLRELARVLRPGGRLVIGELGRWSLWATVRRVRGRLGSPTWRAAHFRTAAELRALVAEAGIEVDTVRGAIYYPPLGALAHLCAGVDPWLGRLTTWGAAFLAVAGRKRC